jgi:hypothetical protein
MHRQRQFEVDTYGFTVLESVIDAAHARELADAVSAADASIGTDYVHQEAYARHVMNLLACDERFLALVDHPVVLDAVETVLGPDVILGSLNARIVRPGDPDQPFHSDIPGQFRKPGAPIMVQAVWMLDGFNRRQRRDAHRARVAPRRGRRASARGRSVTLARADRTRGECAVVQRPVLARWRRELQRRDPARGVRPLPRRSLDALPVRSARRVLRIGVGVDE